MKRCRECGGDVVSKNGRYICKYCGAEFEEAAPATQRIEMVTRSNDGVDVFQKNINGILEIRCTFDRCASAGSGLLISQDGYALTNTHVVTNEAIPCESITVKIAGQTVGAQIVRLGDDNGGHGNGVDLALIKLDFIPREATVIERGDFSKVKTGEQVFVIGNSLGDGTCITSGIVSDKRRTLEGKTLMMTDCAINGGNSGGPIFNKDGLAIGVIVSSRLNNGAPTEGMNYAIPMDIVESFLNDGERRASPTGGRFEGPTTRGTICVYCGALVTEGSAGNCWCDACGKRWNKGIVKRGGGFSFPPKTPPPITVGPRCPKCKSSDTDVQNNIAHCYSCGNEWYSKQ